MEELKTKKYLTITKRKSNPISVLIGFGGIVFALSAIISTKTLSQYWDIRSLIAILGGTLGILIFQFNLGIFLQAFNYLFQTVLGTPDKNTLHLIEQVDQAIINKSHLTTLREGRELNGDYLNDSLYMVQQGLIFEEIESFFTSKVSDEYQRREVCVDFLKKGAAIAPALGLFGTVMGMIGVLKSLNDPTQIGPSMSLALMTTAYGAGLGSLFFNPLAGRLEQHNYFYLETYQQLFNKIKILISREERRIDRELHMDQEEAS